MRVKRILTTALLGAAATAMLPTAADASLVLDLQNGASTITDNGAGDSDATPGRIINSSTVGGFGITITVATSNSPGTSTGGLLQIESLSIQNGNASPASLVINLSDIGFTNPGGAGDLMALESSAGGTFTFGVNGDTASFQSFADPNNGQPATTNPTALQSFIKSGPNVQSSFNNTTVGGFTRNSGAYSLANRINLTLSPGGQLNFSGTTLAYVSESNGVPEPTALSLAAIAGAGLITRRRRA